MTDHRFRLSDEQFARPKPLLANKPRGVPRVDDRRVIGGIIDVIGRAKGGPNAKPRRDLRYRRPFACTHLQNLLTQLQWISHRINIINL